MKKQKLKYYCSLTEIEFREMTLGICEALWLRLVLIDLSYSPKAPIQLYCDNKVARDIAHNPVQHNHTNLAILSN